MDRSMSKCLMIKTKDNRKFFTHEKNYLHLIEFSKIFDAEISVVKLTAPANVLELNELAPAICNASYKDKADYQLIETKVAKFKKIKPEKPCKRKQILYTAHQVKDFIINELNKGNQISIKELLQQFPTLHMSTLCNHVKNAINDLKASGTQIIRLGKGKYIKN